jgi:hypothetical protein
MTCTLAAKMRPHRRVCLALALATLLYPVSVAVAQDGVRVDPGPIWTARTENDKFSTVPGGTDRYYTAGNQVAYTSSPNGVPQAASDFGRFLFGGGTTWLGVSVGQQLYTPRDTRLIRPDPNDRPYAGYLAATVNLIQDVENTRNVIGASLGVIGPSAGGRLVQNGFHTFIGSEQSHGWSAQLHDEPALQLIASRTWRQQLFALGPVETDVLPAVTVGVGTVRDYAQVGGRLRIGHGLERDFGPSRITDGLNGGDAYLPGDGLGYYLFVGVSGQAIARDAFLDGTLGGRSAHVSRRPLMADAEGGFAVLWRGARISYTHTWQTDAFRGQKVGLFNFGSIALSTRF